MDQPVDVVRRMWDSMQERNWADVAQTLAPDFEVWWPATGERFTSASSVAMNQAYPEGWSISIEEMISDGDRVAARVSVDHQGARYWCCGFYLVKGDRIASAIESWVTEGGEEPPAWRSKFSRE